MYIRLTYIGFRKEYIDENTYDVGRYRYIEKNITTTENCWQSNVFEFPPFQISTVNLIQRVN